MTAPVAYEANISFILRYYRIFMYYYAYSLRQARFIMVNSSWTKNHVDSILNHSDRALDMIHLLPPLVILELLSRRRSECPKAAQIVYPSCDTRQMTVFPIEGRERLILSLAQFRLVEHRLNRIVDEQSLMSTKAREATSSAIAFVPKTIGEPS